MDILAALESRNPAVATRNLRALFADRPTVAIWMTMADSIIIRDMRNDDCSLSAELALGINGWRVYEPAGLPVSMIASIGEE